MRHIASGISIRSPIATEMEEVGVPQALLQPT